MPNLSIFLFLALTIFGENVSAKNLWTPKPRGMAGRFYGCCPQNGREVGCTHGKVQCTNGRVSLTCECDDTEVPFEKEDMKDPNDSWKWR